MDTHTHAREHIHTHTHTYTHTLVYQQECYVIYPALVLGSVGFTRVFYITVFADYK